MIFMAGMRGFVPAIFKIYIKIMKVREKQLYEQKNI